MRLIVSTSAEARLLAACEFVERFPPAMEIVVVGASRGAADDLARRIASRRRATFGISRFSLAQLAARAAASGPAGRPRVPGTQAAAEAFAARAAFEARVGDELTYFSPVAAMPGFPRALARTLHELRLAGMSSGRTAGPEDQGPAGDLGRLLARVERELDGAGVDDRAALFRLAAGAWNTGRIGWANQPMVMLDVPLDSHVEREFVAALAGRAPDLLATMPEGDQFALAAWTAITAGAGHGSASDRAGHEGAGANGGSRRDAARPSAHMVRVPDAAGPETDLAHLRRFVFTVERPPARPLAGDVRLFSAPGEGREAIEIVRRALDEAARGVRFDEMAVFLRTPLQYFGLLEHACARGGVPVYFDRGTRRPDPSGRAFVALLACAVEGLSARRFDEYLSLGQVPQIGGSGIEPVLVVPQDELFAGLAVEIGAALVEPGTDDVDGLADGLQERAPAAADSDDDAVVAGTLRSPWKWEALIVESAIVGGRSREDGRARWRRRLDGLAADYRYRAGELTREEPESPRLVHLERALRNLGHLRAFALPVVDTLAEWPDRAMWGEWIERWSALAVRVLRRPARVLRTLADLRPMSAIGPVGLEEALDVVRERLVSLDRDPPARRYGRLFVGTPHQARGRSFRVVFVPGLAERLVPQRPREDPLLLDEVRTIVEAASKGGGLVRQAERAAAERLLLRLAIGAAGDRLYLSYPRLDVAETRARVPSFYALDVMRAMTGQIPDHRALAAEAAAEGGASLAWPAPNDPGRAIDDLEHDLATLKPLIDVRDPAGVKGHAHYLLGLNESLKRSVTSRWMRAKKPWSTGDGLVRATSRTKAALDACRLDQRPYSLSALQRFATCPYQFLLSAIYRLEPRDEPEPLMRMDPLTRGSLFHRAQTEFYRAMQALGALPVAAADVSRAVRVLDEVVDRVAAEYQEELVPAIDRVWRDEINDVRRDLDIWVRKLAEGTAWWPEYFEFSFGLHDEGRDVRSLPDDVVLDGRFRLRGSVDLIERDAARDVLRVTDHKTGKNRSNPRLVLDGGRMLQPVLYSAVVEQGLGKRVVAGRLFYCTTAGGFGEHEIPINEDTRGRGLEALAVIDRSIELGFLVACPEERACTWCDFRPVCGPREEERILRKDTGRLADLVALRSMP